VESILAKYARGPARALSSDREQLVWDVLTPTFRLVRSLGPMVESQERELFRLTREQWERLRDLDGNRRLIVTGVAGSGKTVLAVQKAASLADEGAKVLLLCFNRALADHLSGEPALRSAGVKVANFHALCGEWAKAAAVPFEVPREGEAVREFWETEAAGLLAQAIARKPGDYDALIVDEAQDFRPAWWPPVVSALRDPEEGHFYVFTDPDQNIFESRAKLPFKGPVKKLRFNCRNTQAIAERLHELIGRPMETPPFVVEGVPVAEHERASDESERALVEELVRGFTSGQGLRPEQVALLSPHKLEHSSLAGLKSVGGHPLARTVHEPVPGAVRFATIGGFKGLESDCVVVFGVRKGDDKAEPRDLYVACSRAKHVLHVVRRSDADEGS
jgi:superfamily I DNA/RNA helicase